jgi:hypothetical protein
MSNELKTRDCLCIRHFVVEHAYECESLALNCGPIFYVILIEHTSRRLEWIAASHMCDAHGTGKTRRLLSRTIDMLPSAAHWRILEISDSLISALSGLCCIVELLGHCDRLDQMPTG